MLSCNVTDLFDSVFIVCSIACYCMSVDQLSNEVNSLMCLMLKDQVFWDKLTQRQYNELEATQMQDNNPFCMYSHDHAWHRKWDL